MLPQCHVPTRTSRAGQIISSVRLGHDRHARDQRERDADARRPTSAENASRSCSRRPVGDDVPVG